MSPITRKKQKRLAQELDRIQIQIEIAERRQHYDAVLYWDDKMDGILMKWHGDLNGVIGHMLR